MGTESNEEKSGAEYLAQLLKDKKQIQAFSNVFIHVERILDDGESTFFSYYFCLFVLEICFANLL